MSDKQFVILVVVLIAACITALILLHEPEPPKIPYQMEVPTNASELI